MQTIINRHRYRIVYAPGLYETYGVYGDCDPVRKRHKAIRLEPNQTDPELLDTLIHELSHVVLPDLREDVIERIAGDYARVILAFFDIKRKAEPCESESLAISTCHSSTPFTSSSSTTLSDNGE